MVIVFRAVESLLHTLYNLIASPWTVTATKLDSAALSISLASAAGADSSMGKASTQNRWLTAPEVVLLNAASKYGSSKVNPGMAIKCCWIARLSSSKKKMLSKFPRLRDCSSLLCFFQMNLRQLKSTSRRMGSLW